MPLKGLIRELQDIRDGFGSLSRRNFEVKIFPVQRVRSHIDDSGRRWGTAKPIKEEQQQQSCWVNLPPELLTDIISRIEESEGTWPSRKNVVACAAVCRMWRDSVKELVNSVEKSGKITFPISLKQPGPRDAAIQCFIKRDRATSTYRLYLGLTPALAENGKFLLAAKRFRRAASTDYIISLDANDMSQGTNSYIGKLRSNFLATKFTVHGSQPLSYGLIPSSLRASRRILLKQVSTRVPAVNSGIAHISYELNVLGARGPRRMHCILDSIPISAMQQWGSAPTPTEWSQMLRSSLLSSMSCMAGRDATEMGHGGASSNSPLVLRNKTPRWHEQLQCWCLNFRGRVTVASVKNFQLVAALDPSQLSSPADHEKVLLQFGKVGKDAFTMDYRYPLSAFQAFAICLSSFDTKLACE